MKLCIPVQENKGLQSGINPHFGSAAYFLVVDTETGGCRSISNRVHDQGRCRPAESLSEETIDGVVVGGIGRGALLNLQSAGIRVFLSNDGTAGEAVEKFKSNKLPAANPGECCGGHGGQEGGCSHG